MNMQEAMDYMESLKRLGIVPGLTQIRELLRRMGNPQNGLNFVHIAGTNGKGSVLAYISTILQTAGYRVGRYSSPAVREYPERIQVNAKNITQKAFTQELDRIRKICEEMTADGFAHPTPFEVETAMAFSYFAQKNCDIVVLECGMGGLEDATNVIENALTVVLTSIGMDHMQFLGDTPEKIAAQKAGIIKKGSRVVMLEQADSVLRTVAKKAAEEGAELTVTGASQADHIRYGIQRQKFHYAGMKDLTITLAGVCQIDNAILAIEAVKSLADRGFPVTEEQLRKGLSQTCWPGRFSVLSRKPLLVIDGAHNEDAARKLAQSIEFYFTNKRIIYIMGILKDKEYGKIIDITAGYADQIITVATPGNERALSSVELAQAVYPVNPHVTAASSVEEALEMAELLAGPEDVILAFGSLSFLGRIMELQKVRSAGGKPARSLQNKKKRPDPKK